jgi:hypothetical protein
MKPTAIATYSAGGEEFAMHVWRTDQLQRQGLSREIADAFADFVDWHAIAALVRRGCPPELALDIVH